MKQLTAMLFLLLFATNTWSGWFGDNFFDPSDGQLDLSNWLLN